jgi:hypothetical protein
LANVKDSIKRVTLEINEAQHRRLRAASSMFSVTQQDLLGLLIDITLTNPETIRKPVEIFVRRKKAEEEKARQLEDRAKNFISRLSQDQQDKLLSGELELSALL